MVLCALILNPIARRRRKRLAATDVAEGAATPESRVDTVIEVPQEDKRLEVVDVEKGPA